MRGSDSAKNHPHAFLYYEITTAVCMAFAANIGITLNSDARNCLFYSGNDGQLGREAAV